MLVSSLHLVTDTRSGRDPLPEVEAALRAGADWIQVRAKGCPDRDLLTLTRRVVERARAFAATVVVDDRADVAVAAGADGVHVGGQDLPVEEVRRIVGPEAVVGATARDTRSGRAAVAAGADYLGAGPAFATLTKAGLPAPLGVAGVAAVAQAVPVPVIAIGGVDRGHVPALMRAGLHGVAVVSAVSQAPDPAAAVSELLALLRAPVDSPC